MNPHVRNLSPHLEAALCYASGSLGAEAANAGWGQRDDTLLRAFPLDRARVDSEILAYAEDPDANGPGYYDPPYDGFLRARMILSRHMRLAFEEGAPWLVEMLEPERESTAAQAAYALALEREAGLE